MDELLGVLRQWVKEDGQAILATVIEQKGPAPRSIGAKMAIRSDMQFCGSVSGGCVEGDVVHLAKNVLQTGLPVVKDYGVSDDQAWSVGLACGGQIRVLIQPVINQITGFGITDDLLGCLEKSYQNGEKICVVTVISKDRCGETCLVANGKVIYPTDKVPDWLSEDLLSRVIDEESQAQTGIVNLEGKEVFLNWYGQQDRMIVVGGVHIAIPLITMAKILGYSTILVDPRRLFASPERFNDVDRLITKWPVDGFVEINLNKDDFLVILSHDDKLDLPALAQGLRKKCKYIGMLSSQATRNKRFECMRAEGFSDEELKKVHAPIGLDIGSSTPEEIALSIVAEITACKYGK